MASKKLIDVANNESPSQYADRLGLQYSKSVSQEHKKLTDNSSLRRK